MGININGHFLATILSKPPEEGMFAQIFEENPVNYFDYWSLDPYTLDTI